MKFVVTLRPEGGTPALVERGEVSVPRPQPVAERHRRGLAVALPERGAVLVVDVPEHDGEMMTVPRRELPGDTGGGLRVSGARRAVRLARPAAEGEPLPGDRVRLRMLAQEPGRRVAPGVLPVEPRLRAG